MLTRIEGVIVVKDPPVRARRSTGRTCIAPLLAVWLFVLHRLAGPRIKWKVGLRWAAVAGGLRRGMLVVVQAQDPRQWNVVGPEGGRAVLLPVAGAHRDRQLHPGEDADERRTA